MSICIFKHSFPDILRTSMVLRVVKAALPRSNCKVATQDSRPGIQVSRVRLVGSLLLILLLVLVLSRISTITTTITIIGLEGLAGWVRAARPAELGLAMRATHACNA